MVDIDGAVRVSVRATSLRELLAMAVGGPLHYGEHDPDVLEGLMEVVLMAGWVARQKEDRAAARSWLARIEGLARESELGAERTRALAGRGGAGAKVARLG